MVRKLLNCRVIHANNRGSQTAVTKAVLTLVPSAVHVHVVAMSKANFSSSLGVSGAVSLSGSVPRDLRVI